MYVDSCAYDLCALEGKPADQDRYRCSTFETLTSICYSYSNVINILWRTPTNCRENSLFTPLIYKTKFFIFFCFYVAITCDTHETFGVKTQCPKTCLNPAGFNCNAVQTIEGCFCNDGYVLNGQNVCVPPNRCGCALPDGSYLEV